MGSKNTINKFMRVAAWLMLSYSSQALAQVNYNDLSSYDFNRDGKNDTVKYKSSQYDFEIINGADGSQLFYFAGETESGTGRKLLISDFEIVKLDGVNPSVIIAAHYVDSGGYPRYIGPQKLLLNSGGVLKLQNISSYLAGGYSVSCTDASKTFAKSPYNTGAICFTGAYWGNTDYYWDGGLGTWVYRARNALYHINASGVVTDLTKLAGLPWDGGFAGTGVGASDNRVINSKFPHSVMDPKRYCGNPSSYEKWHIMGVGWVDSNSDGKMDLVVTGQHMRSYAYLQRSSTNALGIAFSEVNATPYAGENLVIGAADAQNQRNINSSCYYHAVEPDCGDSDYLVCNEGGTFVRKDLPFKHKNNVNAVSVRSDANNVYFKSSYFLFSYPLNSSTASKVAKCVNDSINGATCAGNITGNIDNVTATEITGWACLKNRAQSIQVHVYAGGPAGQGSYVGAATANLTTEAAVRTACGVGSGNYRFKFAVTDSMLRNFSGKPVHVHGIVPSPYQNVKESLTIAQSGVKKFPLYTLPGEGYKLVRADATDSIVNMSPINSIDANLNSSYSSNGRSTAAVTGLVLSAWMKDYKPQAVKAIILKARMLSGKPVAFPVKYNISLRSLSSGDYTGWVSLGTFTKQPDANGVVRIQLSSVYQTSGISIAPVTLGQDNYGGYYFQMAEMELAP